MMRRLVAQVVGARRCAVARYVLAVAVVAGSAVFAPAGTATALLSQAVCGEPNDEFQLACFIGVEADAVGFISAPGDVDAYRFEVLEFNVQVRAEISGMPIPYRLSIANWNGDILASAPGRDWSVAIELALGLPGSYYFFVDSPSGRFSADRPYRLSHRLGYPSAVPGVLFSESFPPGAIEGVLGATARAEAIDAGGRSTIAMNVGGTPSEPLTAWARFGPTLSDFTLTVDSRVDQAEAGYLILLRLADSADGVILYVNTRDGMVRPATMIDDEVSPLTEWIRFEAIDTDGGVNRTVVRCVGQEIEIYINGRHGVQIRAAIPSAGRIGLGAIAWGDPPRVNFDNLLITTPTSE